MVSLLRWQCFLAALPPLVLHLWTALPQTFDGFEPSAVRGQRVLVCGASMGIGEELVYQYARLGAHVAALARSGVELRRVTARALELGAASATAVVADLSTLSGAQGAIEATLRAEGFQGELDVLVLNHIMGFWGWYLPTNITSAAAGEIGFPAEGIEGGFTAVERILQVNTLSYMYLSTLAAPALVRSGSAVPGRNGGQLVVVSSAAGKLGFPKVAPYAGSKHALHGYFDSLRLELVLKQLPVSITVCVLGHINTANNRKNTAELKYAPERAPADETAMAILRGGATRQREIYYPLSQGLHIMVMLRPLIPSLLDRIILFMAS